MGTSHESTCGELSAVPRRLFALCEHLVTQSPWLPPGADGEPVRVAFGGDRGTWQPYACFPRAMRQFVIARLEPTTGLSAKPIVTLSARERSVMELVAYGQSLKMVAITCGISLQAVSTYLHRARRKLCAASPTDLLHALATRPSAGVPCDFRAVFQPLVDVREGEAWFRIFGGPLFGDGAERTLTYAESEVLLLVLRGLQNENIAHSRGTSARTVAAQINSLSRKLGARSRAELIVPMIVDGTRGVGKQTID